MEICCLRLNHTANGAHRLFTAFVAANVKDEQTVAVISFDCRAFNRAREANRFFKTAVGDFKLVVGDALRVEGVAAAAREVQRRALKTDLDFIGADAGQLDFDNPPVAGPVNVRRWIP